MLILERIPGRREQFRVSRMIERARPHPLDPPLRREDSDRLIPAAAENGKFERASRSNISPPPTHAARGRAAGQLEGARGWGSVRAERDVGEPSWGPSASVALPPRMEHTPSSLLSSGTYAEWNLAYNS
jgi:hypothetical protein